MKFPFVLLALGLLACQSRTREGRPSPDPAAAVGSSHPSALGTVPGGSTDAMDEEWRKHVESVLNPSAKPYYTGPVGSLHGTVRMRGDAAPARDITSIPVGKCFDAHSRLKSVFRAGPNGELADVLVAATGYDALLKPVNTPLTLHTRGCAYDQQTAVVTFGQEILTQNHGPEAASPQLVGSPSKVLRFAIPGGNPTPVRPHKPGHFMLIDRSNPFNTVQVYALNYPTATVSDLQGHYEIHGIPVGEVTLNALLPSTGSGGEQKVTVVEGKSVEVNFELTFKLADYEATLKSAEVAPSASAAPHPTQLP
jgi:hypothetical protein